MPTRRRYLACYDIRDQRRLQRMGKLMKKYGYAVQYSVFACDLDGMERARLAAEARALMNLAEDSLLLIDLGVPGAARLEFIGRREMEPPGPGPVIL